MRDDRPAIPRNLRYFSRISTWLRGLLARRNVVVVNLVGPNAREDLGTILETRRRTALLMGDGAAIQIQACARTARRLGGAMAEAGVLMGGTARLICEVKGDLPLHLFDVFETLQSPAAPEVTQREAELRGHFGGIHAVQQRVDQLLAPYAGVHFHPGIFPDTTRGLEDERFCFVHLDLDLEPSTRDALAFFHPRMIPGGIIVGDDYNHAQVRNPFEAFFAGRADTVIEMPWGQVVVIVAAS